MAATMAAPVANSTSADCDCSPPPPPDFRVPPPPRPPFLATPRENLQDGKECLDRPALVAELASCTAVPLVDPEFRSSPALPSIAVIVVCALLLLAMFMMASVLIWKHKRKVQNFLPCKASPQSRCSVGVANGVIYEDLTNIRPRPPPPHCPVVQVGGPPAPLELIDVVLSASVKYGEAGQQPSVFICTPPPLAPVEHHIYSSYLPTAVEGQHLRGEPASSHRNSKDLYNPVYEELSNGSEAAGSDPGSNGRRRRRTLRRGAVEAPGASEDEFAEDELSDRADDSSSSSCSDPECRRLRVQTDAVPRAAAPHGPGPPPRHAATRPRRPPPHGASSSSERRRWRKDPAPPPSRPPLFLAPAPPPSSSSSSSASYSALLPPPPPGAQRLVCVPPAGAASLRSSRDSFGSDSGFSNNTSGGGRGVASSSSCRLALPIMHHVAGATELPFYEPGGGASVVPT